MLPYNDRSSLIFRRWPDPLPIDGKLDATIVRRYKIIAFGCHAIQTALYLQTAYKCKVYKSSFLVGFNLCILSLNFGYRFFPAKNQGWRFRLTNTGNTLSTYLMMIHSLALILLKMPGSGLGNLALFMACPIISYKLASRPFIAFSKGTKDITSLIEKAVKQGNIKLLDELQGRVKFENLGPFKLDLAHYAASQGDILILKDLIKRDPGIIQKLDQNGNTLLHWAVIGNKTDCVTFLLSIGIDTEKRNHKERTALLCAADKGNAATLSLLLNINANKDAVDDEGNNSLHLVLAHPNFEKEKLECLELLLAKNLDINSKNKKGETILHLAVQNNLTSCIKLILEKGALLEARDKKGKTALYYAFKEQMRDSQQSYDLVKLLLDQGAVIDPFYEQESTYLHQAIKQRNYKIIYSLIQEHHLNVNAVNKDGDTPLHIAVQFAGKLEMDRLLSKGAKIDIKNKKGNTVLHLAAIKSYDEYYEIQINLLSTLLEHHLDINVQNLAGETPLHHAVSFGIYENVVRLLSHKANIAICDSKGKNVIHTAIEKGYYYLLRALLKDQVPPILKNRKGNIWENPCGGETWMPETNYTNKELNKQVLEIPFLYHDVPLARRLFPLMEKEQFEQNIAYLESKYPKEMVLWLKNEKDYQDKGIKINPSHYQVTAEQMVPEAPNDIHLDKACDIILSLLKKVQNTDSSLPGYVKMNLHTLELGVKVFLKHIQSNQSMSPYKYKKMENLLRHIALFVLDPENQIWKKANDERLAKGEAPLPKLDDDHRAIVLEDFANASQVCDVGGTGELWSTYDFLQGNMEAGQVPFEQKLTKFLEQQRELVVGRLISTYRKSDGSILHTAYHVHMGLQIRKHLGEKRGIRGHEIPEARDSCVTISEMSTLNAFDKYYTIDAIVDALDQAINGPKDEKGKRIAGGKVLFSADELFTWLVDHFAPAELLKNRFAFGQGNDYVNDRFYKMNDALVPEITKEGIIQLLSHPKVVVLLK